MKKIHIYLLTLAALLGLGSCADVDFAEATYSEAVSNLKAFVKEGTRELTLTWTNPQAAGQTGVRIIENLTTTTDIDSVVSEWTNRKAPVNATVPFTVKAMYADGRVSEGQTVMVNIPYEQNAVAMLVPDDYTTSADEKAAAEWFQTNYVAQGKGTLLTPSTIERLDPVYQAGVWVMCDRVGVEKGWQNLPGNLAAEKTINALKAFASDGCGIFLTNHATQLTVPLGRLPEAYAPGIFGNGPGGQNNDVWGTNPVIGNVEGQIYDHSHHEIFANMDFTEGLYERAIYCFEGSGVKGDHNCMWDLNAYGLPATPNVVKAWEDATNSTVLGTWNHVVDYCCAGIVDFNPTTTFDGRVLAVGLASYEWDIEGTNEKQDQLETFTRNCLAYVATPDERKMAMLVATDYENSADEKAAVEWFKQTYVNAGRGDLYTPATFTALDPETYPVVWVMADRVGIDRGWQHLPGDLAATKTINALKAFAEKGGNLLLTNHATQLTVPLGRLPEDYAPGIFGNGPGGQNNDVWGTNPVIGNAEGQIYDHSQHPIFGGMNFTEGLYERAIYCFEGSGVKGDHNCMWDLNAYGLPATPNVVKAWEDATNSTVLGTWNHVLDYCCAGIVDFNPTAAFPPRVLAVGLASYEWDTEGANDYRDQLERFTRNCMKYLK